MIYERINSHGNNIWRSCPGDKNTAQPIGYKGEKEMVDEDREGGWQALFQNDIIANLRTNLHNSYNSSIFSNNPAIGLMISILYWIRPSINPLFSTRTLAVAIWQLPKVNIQ